MPRLIVLALAGAISALASGTILQCGTSDSPPAAEVWPDESVTLSEVPSSFPPEFGVHRIVVDPGHGAEGNHGNVSCLCEKEQDYTLRIAQYLREHLEQTGHFEVRLSRDPGKLVAYPDRVASAEKWNAALFLSLHSDVRGSGEPWTSPDGEVCMRSNGAPGFSVLWSDQAPEPLTVRRRALAQLVARNMAASGFLPYHGVGYGSLYQRDDKQLGVFVDRHERHKRIFVLQKPAMPSIIIETHHAWDEREVERWNQQTTLRAWGAAVTAALVEILSSRSP